MNTEIKNLADVLAMWTVLYHQASFHLDAARDADRDAVTIRVMEEQQDYCWNKLFFYQEEFNAACKAHALANV